MNDNQYYLPQRKPLPCQPAGDETMVRVPESGQVHFLNATASVVWNCCDGISSPAICEAKMRDAFDIPADANVAEDIREIISDFQAKGLVDG